MWQSADTILWLDYPAVVVLPRLIRRSVLRTATNAELFGGNRETLREWLSPEHPVWSAAATFRERRSAAGTGPPGLRTTARSGSPPSVSSSAGSRSCDQVQNQFHPERSRGFA